MKAYAPSDRGTSAAVVVSQELLTAAVTGLQPTKEREKASIIFFCLPNIFLDSNGTTKERKSFDSVLFICTIFFYSKVFIFVLPARVQPRRGKRLRQCSFFVSFLYLFHTLIFVHLARNQNSGCKGKEKAKQSIQFSLIHVVITKTKQKP